MPKGLTDLDQDAETPVDEVYQDELEGTGHVSDADADTDAATLEDLDCYGVQVPVSMYKQDAVANVEQYLALHHPERKLKNKFSGPWPNRFASEMDVTPELDAERANYYWPQAGVLHWMVKIGRVDVITEVSPWLLLWSCQEKGTWMHCLMSSDT